MSWEDQNMKDNARNIAKTFVTALLASFLLTACAIIIINDPEIETELDPYWEPVPEETEE